MLLFCNQMVYQLINIFCVTYVLLIFLDKSNMGIDALFTVVYEWCLSHCKRSIIKKSLGRGWSQDGRRIGRGDHFLPHKFIKRSFECWATSTKQLLNTGRRYQSPRKAAQSLQKEVGQNIKDKKRDKELGTKICPGEGVVKEEKFPNSRKPSHRQVHIEFWNHRGQHNWEGKKNPIE